MKKRSRFRRNAALALAVAITGTVAGCIQLIQTTAVRPLDPASTKPDSIRSPVKAHLKDGSTVAFRNGATIHDRLIDGAGMSYPLMSRTGSLRGRVPLDSVVGLEAFETKELAAESLVLTVAATAITGLAFAGLAIAIFGSCPTVYADAGSGPVLQAEGFSYAIAPLLEHRDVDPLRVRAEADGTVRLELRNEALETHFINQIEILSVPHAPDARVIPDQSGHIVAVSGLRPFTQARDRAGRDVRGALKSIDSKVFASLPSVVDSARVGDIDDWIDLEADNLPPGDSIAVVIRLRNSLLNTVLLYEGILGGRDAIDWMTNGLLQIANAYDLAKWYSATMGLRAYTDTSAAALMQPPSARLGDVGPIAFREVALVLPRPKGTRAHVRLRFVADNWRIDQAVLGTVVTRPVVSRLPIARVEIPRTEDGGTAIDTAAVGALVDSDNRYLETRPGQRMMLVFKPGSAAGQRVGDSKTTFLIAWQGWYREWIRGAWLAEPTRTTAFVPGDAAVLAAMRMWRSKQSAFERQFYSTKIPVQ